MEVQIVKEFLHGGVVVKPTVFQDKRGFFMEAYCQEEFKKVGLPTNFVQLNHSGSSKNILRGLHFQWEPPMGKMMRVTRGTAFLVAVDIRIDSPTLGKWFGVEVSAENHLQIFAPAGFARGFCVLSDYAEVQYLCTGCYNNKAESGILWNDPEIGIDWPIKDPILSEKDKKAQTFKEWLEKEEAKQFNI